MRLFLDANILFSAAKSDGAVRELLRRLHAAGHECWVDDYVAFEVRRNLVVKGPDAMAAFEALLPGLRFGATQVPRAAMRELDWLAEKDRPVLAAAMHLRCHALVTGDRTHFGAAYGKVFGAVAIHSPRSLADGLGLG
jgi:galactose-1-phosphate uridylyltransferase